MSMIVPDEIKVLLQHPHGDIILSLSKWIEVGPGNRPLLSPYKVFYENGNELSKNIIPFKYRNNFLSRFMIRLKLIENPWKNE